LRTAIDIPEPEFGDPAEIAMLIRLREEGPALVRQYIADRTRDGVTFVSRDAAKMLFPEYMENPTGNNKYSDRAASALAEAVRLQLLSKPPLLPRNEVAIITGTPASGKSVSSAEISGPTIEIIHETILTSLPKARQRILEAIEAKRLPQIILVYTNHPRIHVRRMIARARAIGRTVPVAYMAETYVGVPLMVANLQSEFGSGLRTTLMNNSSTGADVVLHHDIQQLFADLGRYTVESCLRVMDDELSQIHKGDPIPPGILQEAKRRGGN
jgi:hypothetical protein